MRCTIDRADVLRELISNRVLPLAAPGPASMKGSSKPPTDAVIVRFFWLTERPERRILCGSKGPSVASGRINPAFRSPIRFGAESRAKMRPVRVRPWEMTC
jgi:hypothetical protein